MNDVMDMVEFKLNKVEKNNKSDKEWEERKKCWDMIYNKLNKKKSKK